VTEMSISESGKAESGRVNNANNKGLHGKS
jgi:hypothetical protein